MAASVSTEPAAGFLNDATTEWFVESRKESGIAKIHHPLFQQHSVKPTYLISPEVLNDTQSVETLKQLKDCELGTHLHTEYIEPDIKHLDPKEHKKGTGLENKKIIQNLKYLNSVRSNLILQIALIPGYNDSEDHLEAVFSLARELESVQGVSLLAYHSLGVSKYKRLGRKYLLSDISIPSRDYLDKKKVWAKQFGVPLISFWGSELKSQAYII